MQRAKLRNWDSTGFKILDDYIASKGGLTNIFPYINDIEKPTFRELVLSNEEGCANQFKDVLNYIISYAKEHKDEKFVVEGVQIAFYASDDIIAKISEYPVVIKMTGPLKAEFRRDIRLINSKKESGDSFADIFKKISHRISNWFKEGFYKSDFDKINSFKSAIGESFIPLKREHKEIDHVKNCISYAMGVDDSINELKSQGFGIFPDGEDYKVRFNADKSEIWESYINEHLKDTYWNEYINLNTMDIVFMIKENDTIQRIENHDMEENDSLLETCNRLCEGNFKTIKDLIYSNDFYKEAIENNPFKLKFDNPNIHMRPATEDDIENMYQWEMESIDKSLVDNEKVQSLIRQDCYDSLKDTLMIMDGDNTIGMFTACMIDNGEWRYIGEIYLIPEYRGQGIGSTILRNEMANYDKIRLQVAMDNEGAFKLYTSLGFKIAKEDETNKMYIMEYEKPEAVQEAVTVDGYRLIELAFMDKMPNMTPEQETVLRDYANARDQLTAAASYYTRETKARKKMLKRMQLEHNTSKSEYQRNKLKAEMATIRQEIDVIARDYGEAYQRNVAEMNRLADEFDKLEAMRQKTESESKPKAPEEGPDVITIPIPKFLKKPLGMMTKFLKAEENTEL